MSTPPKGSTVFSVRNAIWKSGRAKNSSHLKDAGRTRFNRLAIITLGCFFCAFFSCSKPVEITSENVLSFAVRPEVSHLSKDEVSEGIHPKFEVTLNNNGKKPYQIVDVVKSCSCVGVDIDGKVIPGLGHFSFNVEVDPSRRIGNCKESLFIYLEGVPGAVRVDLNFIIGAPLAFSSRILRPWATKKTRGRIQEFSFDAFFTVGSYDLELLSSLKLAIQSNGGMEIEALSLGIKRRRGGNFTRFFHIVGTLSESYRGWGGQGISFLDENGLPTGPRIDIAPILKY